MSKMDGLRAMREARYADAQRRAAQAKPAVRAPAPVAPTPPPKAEAPVEEPDDGACGHRSMNGRTCTRERGHAAKSHRYG